MAYWMQQPVLPFIVETLSAKLNEGDSDPDPDNKLGSYSTAYGYLQTMVSTLYLTGGPLIGKFTDKAGAKQSLILCQIGSAASYFLLGASTTLQMLFISRLTTIFQSVMQTAQASVALLIDEQNREQSMGRLSMAYGIGMILGSSTGGLISKYTSLQFNAFVAGFITMICVALNFMFLPSLKAVGSTRAHSAAPKKTDNSETETLLENEGGTDRNGANQQRSSSSGIFGNFAEIIALALRPSVRGLCLFLFFAGFGVTLYRSMFSLIFKEVFHFEGWQLGFYISYAALISPLSNSFFVGWARGRFDDDVIVQSCVVVVAVCLGINGYGCSTGFLNIWGLCILAIPQTIAAGFMYVMISGYVSKIVDKTEMGTAIALTHALRSLTGVVTPTIGGHLVQYGYGMVGYFGLCSGMISALLFKSLVTAPKSMRT